MQRSFYYWKSVFRLTPNEKQSLRLLGVKNLYIKFFDIDWEAKTGSAKPIAKLVLSDSIPSGISVTPVVFLTQAPLQKLSSVALDSLAQKTAALLSSIAASNHLNLSNEVQLDCDWTTSTREAYFSFLKRLRQEPFFKGNTLSATIRLHQLKFLSQAGVPPVDKGLLMCYNMGNLRNAKTDNSIIEEGELKKYISHLQAYPLPMDVALPIFDWWVLFEGDHYKGLLRDFDPHPQASNVARLAFDRDTVINGYSLKAGQWLRHEGSDASTVQACAEAVSKKLTASTVTVILYHLDSTNLSNYSLHELESFYNRLR